MGLRGVVLFFLMAAALPAQAWRGFAGDPQHTAISPVKSQALSRIHWQMPVDLEPQYLSGELLIHYGSPVITAGNTVIVPVKTGAIEGFRVEARAAADGSLRWSQASDYTLPPHEWTPEFGVALTPQGRVYFPGAGGTVRFRDTPDAATGTQGQLAFFGAANYTAAPQAYDAAVRINTPITSDAAGNLYFGFVAGGTTPVPLASGVARIGSDGAGRWTAATTASADPTMSQVAYNCAPALSADGKTLYLAISNGVSGYLVALDSATLAPLARVRLRDPYSGMDAWLTDNATSSPTVGPDGDVYYGVLDNPLGDNHERGWLLHFDATLAQRKTPGAFGWDDTASIVPASMVAAYTGPSKYLLMTKYNDYAVAGGSGINRLAILDPNATQSETRTGVTVMREVLTIAGVTPAPDSAGVKEWCINSAVVDPGTRSILAGSEDGKLYRWDLTANALTESAVLSSGIGEAYTPTVIGPDGTVYGINNSILFAVGAATAPVLQVAPDTLSFNFQLGAPAPPAQFLTITSVPTGVVVQVVAACPWLAASPASGTTPLTAKITADITGISPGSYPCSLSVHGPSGVTANIRVR